MQFLPESRGRHALQTVRAAIDWMFTHTDAGVLLAGVPAVNKPALLMTRLAGGKLNSVIKDAWKLAGGVCDLHYFVLHYSEWREMKNRQGLEVS